MTFKSYMNNNKFDRISFNLDVEFVKADIETLLQVPVKNEHIIKTVWEGKNYIVTKWTHLAYNKVHHIAVIAIAKDNTHVITWKEYPSYGEITPWQYC